ncbi:MAG: hypothetical protein D6695_02510 [Planctomycetota bacterium]|nr:MAG: hypothetical protein D6695_02510 [Planctomycetota bacterium]
MAGYVVRVLSQRLLLGPVLIAALVAGVWLDDWIDRLEAAGWYVELTGRATYPPGVIVLLGVGSLAWLGALELARLYAQTHITVSRRVVVTLTLLGLVMIAFVPESFRGTTGAAMMNTIVTFVLVGSLAFYSRHKRVEGMVAAAGGALLAFAYLGMMFGFLLLIRREWSAWVVLWVVMTTKSSDIGAFFVGRAIGRHKLIPWLSPGKTWEGFFGGLACSALVGALGVWAIDGWEAMSPWQGAVFGCVLAAAGQAGDLVMSLLKRDAGLKDAGQSLPGFGGILDVLDSVLLASPVAFWLLRLV